MLRAFTPNSNLLSEKHWCKSYLIMANLNLCGVRGNEFFIFFVQVRL